MIIPNKQGGFTAIELLITLVIAAIFLFSGYQMYVQVTRAGSTASRTAVLSNVVYDKLRTTVASTVAAHADGCKSAYQSTTAPAAVQVPGVGMITFTTRISCPFILGTATAPQKVFLIRIDASDDGGATQKVSHATFSN